MEKTPNYRVYKVAQICSFVRASDQWGAFSNMGMKFPFMLNDILIKSSEYLYQALKFQNDESTQNLILNAPNALEAKKNAYQYVDEMHAERNKVMRYSLFMKYMAYKEYFDDLFEKTQGKAIVELSFKDDYWGAIKKAVGVYKGVNALGRLWMEIRESKDAISNRVESFSLCGQKIDYKTKARKINLQSQTSFL